MNHTRSVANADGAGLTNDRPGSDDLYVDTMARARLRAAAFDEAADALAGVSGSARASDTPTAAADAAQRRRRILDSVLADLEG